MEEPVRRTLTITQTLSPDGNIDTHLEGEGIDDMLAALGILHGATDAVLTNMMKEKMNDGEGQPNNPTIIMPDFGMGLN